MRADMDCKGKYMLKVAEAGERLCEIILYNPQNPIVFHLVR